MQADRTKQCSKCGLDKAADAFRPKSNWCRDCKRAYQEAYYYANKEHLISKSKQYAENNRERVAAQRHQYGKTHTKQQALRRRVWYEANRDKALAAAKQWAEDNGEALAKYKQAYYQLNREKLAAKNKQHYEANKSKHAESGRAWTKANPDAARVIKLRNKAKRKGAIGSFTAAEWTALKRRFQHRCVCCGRKHRKNDPGSKLTADHVVPLARGGTNYISNVQPLCAHCNSSKSAHHTADYRVKPFTGIAQLALIG